MAVVTSRRFDHVAFDLDGTLVDSRADLAAATNHVRGRFGLAPLEPTSVYALVGEGARRLVERALGPDHAARVDDGIAVFLEYYGAHLLDGTRLYPGMDEALVQLADAGVALSVLSNKPVALSEAILRGLGVHDRFVAVLGGDSLPTRKPHPAGIARLRALTATAPSRMLLVGDSPIDVATAAADGSEFCGVAWGLDPAGLRAVGPLRMVASGAALVRAVLGD